MKKKFFAVLLAVLLAAGALPMTASAAASGDCSAAGDGSVTWKVENGTLTISGSGDMAHYLPGPSIHSEREPSTPWQDYHPKKVVFTSDVKLITREDGNWKTEGGQFWDNQEVESFEVEAGNKTLLAYDDCLYMKIPETGDYYLYAVPPAKKGRLTIMEGAIDRVQYSSYAFLTPCKQLTEIYFPSTWWTKHRPDFNSFGSSIGMVWLRTPSHISSYIVSENHPDSKSINGCIYTKDGKELVLAPHTPPNDEIRIAEGTETFEESFVGWFDIFMQDRHRKTEEPIKLYIPKSMTKFKVKLTSDAPPDWLQIYGYKGTEAERFAKEHNVQFFDLSAAASGDCSAAGDGSVTWKVENSTLTISGTGAMEDFVDMTPPWFEAEDNFARIKTVVIEEGVTNIGVQAFCSWNKHVPAINRVILPSTVHTVGVMAFTGCKELKAFDFSNIKEVGDHSFAGSGITNLVIPDGLQAAAYAFFSCPLSSVTLPENLNYIGKSTSLFIEAVTENTHVYYQGTKAQWDEYCKKNPHPCGFGLDNRPPFPIMHYKDSTSQPDKPTVGGFTDVYAGEYYAEPVKWAVENKITQGESSTTFAPNKTCTRGQIVTFLWRANGSPEPSSTANPFVDVKSGEYYYKAMLWAKEKGITSGTDATHFSPNAACNRAQAVTFLWRANNKPAGSGGSFGDVPSGEYYAEAVKWANGAGVTSGETSTTFAPDKSCTRGQIVTFLYRDKA